MLKQGLDLHLIRVLCTLVETRSATQTAYRLATGNSAITYALNKLRAHYRDPIMVRDKNGLQPTVMALELFTLFQPALEQIELATWHHTSVQAAPARQTLWIRTNALIEVWLMAQLLNDEANTPHTYNFAYSVMPPQARLEALRRRQIDVDIGLPLEDDRAILSFPLSISGLTAFCRAGHPAIGDSLSLAQLQQYRVLTWHHPLESPDREKLLAQFEGSHTLRRPYRSASLVNLLFLSARTDAICLLPEAFSTFVTEMFPLRAVPCPELHHISFDVRAYIHRSQRNSPAITDLIERLPLARRG